MHVHFRLNARHGFDNRCGEPVSALVQCNFHFLLGHRLPFDTLKIDRSFVYSVGESGENSEILQTIVSLAKNLKKKLIAEGIETEAQLTLLQNLGCDYGQGYLLAKPQTKENMEAALYEGRNWLPAKITDSIPGVQVEMDNHLPVF